RFVDAQTVMVNEQRLTARHFIIASGAEPTPLDGFDWSHPCILDSTAALRLEDGVPERLLVVGAGAVGLEAATIMQRFGAQVTVIEALPAILPGSDEEMVRHYTELLGKSGLKLRLATRASDVEYQDDHVQVRLTDGDGNMEVESFERVLVAVGRRPRSAELGLAAAGVDCDSRGFVTVDAGQRSSVEHIYAIGDVAGAPLLAHKAMKEGLVAAANVAGGNLVFDYQIPNVIYTEPEWAAVGMTTAQAEARGIDVRVGKFPLAASGRALTLADSGGLLKIVGDAETDLLLGVHIVGPGASELSVAAAQGV